MFPVYKITQKRKLNALDYSNGKQNVCKFQPTLVWNWIESTAFCAIKGPNSDKFLCSLLCVLYHSHTIKNKHIEYVYDKRISTLIQGFLSNKSLEGTWTVSMAQTKCVLIKVNPSYFTVIRSSSFKPIGFSQKKRIF